MTSEKKIIDLDKILVELGQFGRYQLKTYCFILIPIMLSAVYNSQYIFAAAAVDYRCKVPECEASAADFVTGSWSVYALPDDGKCERFKPVDNATECSAASFWNNQTIKCSSWVYEDDNSIVSEFNLACEEWKRTLVGTIHSVGLFAALPITGYISDRYGRRTALVLTATSAAFTGLVRSFSVSYIMYLVFEFLDATLASGVYSTGFILALEMVGLKYRVLGGNTISIAFAIGQVILAAIAWAVPYWRNLTRILYVPSIIFVIYYFIIEESVRWLISKGKNIEAIKIIYKVAETNRRKLSPETIKTLEEATRVPEKESIETDKSDLERKTVSLARQVLRSRIITSRLLICSFWWISVTLIYYGLSINSVSLAGNNYVNYILTSLVEIPGYVLSMLTLDRFGRKSSIITSFFICGISLVSMPFVPTSISWLRTTLTMVGKLCISGAFSSIYIYTSELFPTTARHSLLGFCSMIGRIGLIIAPQTPLLMVYMVSLPYLLFGIMAATSGLLMLLTPETLNMRLPDSIEEAEKIAKSPRNA